MLDIHRSGRAEIRSCPSKRRILHRRNRSIASDTPSLSVPPSVPYECWLRSPPPRAWSRWARACYNLPSSLLAPSMFPHPVTAAPYPSLRAVAFRRMLFPVWRGQVTTH